MKGEAKLMGAPSTWTEYYLMPNINLAVAKHLIIVCKNNWDSEHAGTVHSCTFTSLKLFYKVVSSSVNL